MYFSLAFSNHKRLQFSFLIASAFIASISAITNNYFTLDTSDLFAELFSIVVTVFFITVILQAYLSIKLFSLLPQKMATKGYVPLGLAGENNHLLLNSRFEKVFFCKKHAQLFFTLDINEFLLSDITSVKLKKISKAYDDNKVLKKIDIMSKHH